MVSLLICYLQQHITVTGQRSAPAYKVFATEFSSVKSPMLLLIGEPRTIIVNHLGASMGRIYFPRVPPLARSAHIYGVSGTVRVSAVPNSRHGQPPLQLNAKPRRTDLIAAPLDVASTNHASFSLPSKTRRRNSLPWNSATIRANSQSGRTGARITNTPSPYLPGVGHPASALSA